MSSGNLLADRRTEFARALFERGDSHAALDLLDQALALVPGWVDGHFLAGAWLEKAGRRDEAVAAYTLCLALDGEDRMGAVLRLALLGAVAAPPAMPQAYVAGVFDEYADRFEAALVERLAYAVPGALHALVVELAGEGAAFARALDLGCGTGLAGERFRAACAWLEGVDLSEGMIAQARRKGLYDALAAGEALAHLSAADAARYDLIVAADVLVYLGDLAPLMAAAGRALAPGGRFAFSVEAADGDSFRLTAGQRYAHAAPYISCALEAAGLEIEALRGATCRLEGGAPLAGFLVVARRPPAATTGDAAAPEAAGAAIQTRGKRLD